MGSSPMRVVNLFLYFLKDSSGGELIVSLGLFLVFIFFVCVGLVAGSWQYWNGRLMTVLDWQAYGSVGVAGS